MSSASEALRTGPPVRMRMVRSPEELVATYLAIGGQFATPFEPHDRRLDEPMARFDRDRELMLCLERHGILRGGVIAFGDDVVTVRAIGVDVDLRGLGVGRRLLETVEALAMRRGARQISLGAAEGARGFYERLGYAGKRAQRRKDLPLPGRMRDLRAERALAGLDLVEGVVVGRPPESSDQPKPRG